MTESSGIVPKSIIDIYYLANTPSFLYKMLRQDSYVQLLSQNSTSELIKSFEERASKPISTIQEMAMSYAFLVALSFKEIHEVKGFFEYAKNIKFEWFSEVANFYLTEYKPAPIIQSINIANENPKINQYNIISP